MELKKIVVTMALPLAMAACTGPLENLREVKPTGTPFTQALSREYLAFSESEREQYDWVDSRHFAVKGNSAASGQIVEPENPDDWSIGDKAALQEAKQVRPRLMQALEASRTRAPALSAVAQVKYDCWLEQLEEGWQTDDIEACRKDLYTALDALERAPRPAPQPPVAARPVEPAERFQTFFDFNSAALTPEARRIVVEAAKALKGTSQPVTVIGYTDRAGSDAYNLRLSERRAEAVRQALIENGVEASRIRTVGEGENNPLVQTADGVRQPQNRRAVIKF